MTPPTDDTTTRGDTDTRFTIGLVLDVVKVLLDHGYDRLEPGQLVELQQHLFHFFYGGADRCYGRSVESVNRPAPPGPTDEAPGGLGEHRAALDRKLAALRESSAACDRAVARYDERWGVGR